MWRIGLLGFWLMVCLTLRAEVLLGPNLERESLSSHLQILRDPEGLMTPEQARVLFRDGQGEACRRAWPQFGFTPDTIWTRFELRSGLATEGTWLLELRTARMDELDWYLYRADGLALAVQAGTQRPHSPCLLNHKFPVLPLSLAPGECVEIILRVRSQTSVHLPLRVWSPLHFAESQGHGEALFATFLGYIVALIFLSLIFGLFSRDLGFVIYSLSLVGVFVNYLITTGHYAWLNLPGIPTASHLGTILSIETTFIMLLFYLRYFFDLRAGTPRFDKWCVRPLIGLTLLMALFEVSISYRVGMQTLLAKALVLGIFSMGVGGFFWIRGNRIARFYVLGFLAFWLLFILIFLQLKGFIPMWTLPELPMLTGLACSMTLFFLAMADRVRDLRRRADESNRQILNLECLVNDGLQEQARQQQVLIRDLHDGIGGLTANVGILAEIGRRGATDEKMRRGFQQIADLAAEGSAEVRGLMNSLETKNVSWADFIVECQRLGEMRLSPHDIGFQMRIEGEPAFDEGPGLLPGLDLLRIYKEALTNVVKHAEAHHAEVLLVFEKTRFRMTISDDGRGISADHPVGRGLASMDSRIQDWGGRMERHAEAGTRLIFELPLPIKSPTQGVSASPETV
jgi:signal transduction histidine kinase